MKLLVIDGDQASVKQLSNALSQHYCVVDIAPDVITGLGMIQQWEYDSILLNLKLPDLDGIHFCQQLRQQSCTTPILVLMHQFDTDAAIRSLDAGADDCLSNSADTRLLLARLRALQRRQTKELSYPLLSWGPLKLDTNHFRVSYRDLPIFLSQREYRLLELFLQHPKRIFTRDTILDKLWTIDDPPSTATVTNLVKDLRRKLRDAGVVGQPITTVHSLGYRLSPPPTEAPTPAAPISHKPCLTYPLPFAQSEHLQELLIQLSHSLAQSSGPCAIELRLRCMFPSGGQLPT